LVMFITYFLLAAYEAACLRWMIRGEVKGLFGLALDADTLRVYFTYWLWFFLLMALYVLLWIVVGAAIVGVAMSAGSSADPAAVMGPGFLIAMLLFLGMILGMIYFGVRFAPAAATSIAKRRFAFFDAWTVTKGRFWALLGSYLLLFLMYFVGIVILGVAAGVAMGFSLFGQMQAGAEPQSMEQMLALFASPSVWIPAVICYGLMIVGAFMFYIALFGVNARAAQAALEEGKIAQA
jgi:Na+/H+ antiporter NhaC